MIEELRTAGWEIDAGHRSGRCEAMAGVGRVRPCLLTGRYGWDGGIYCHRHHPDWDAWFEAMAEIKAIAQKAVDQAVKARFGAAQGTDGVTARGRGNASKQGLIRRRA